VILGSGGCQHLIKQERGQLRAAGDPELVEDRLHVVAEGVPGDEEHLRDVRRWQAAQEQLGDLAFPVGQAMQVEDERRQVGRPGRFQDDRGLAAAVPVVRCQPGGV